MEKKKQLKAERVLKKLELLFTAETCLWVDVSLQWTVNNKVQFNQTDVWFILKRNQNHWADPNPISYTGFRYRVDDSAGR